jgi:hypothetical protein
MASSSTAPARLTGSASVSCLVPPPCAVVGPPASSRHAVSKQEVPGNNTFNKQTPVWRAHSSPAVTPQSCYCCGPVDETEALCHYSPFDPRVETGAATSERVAHETPLSWPSKDEPLIKRGAARMMCTAEPDCCMFKVSLTLQLGAGRSCRIFAASSCC